MTVEGGKQKEWILKKRNPMVSEEHTAVEWREERVRGEGRKQKEWILKKRNPLLSEEHTAVGRREERE